MDNSNLLAKEHAAFEVEVILVPAVEDVDAGLVGDAEDYLTSEKAYYSYLHRVAH